MTKTAIDNKALLKMFVRYIKEYNKYTGDYCKFINKYMEINYKTPVLFIEFLKKYSFTNEYFKCFNRLPINFNTVFIGDLIYKYCLGQYWNELDIKWNKLLLQLMK